MRTGTVKLLSGTILLPLKICSRASNLPGPQLWNGVLSTTVGDSATIAPTLSVRLGQPSRRRPIPVVVESSTVEWHSAQVMPTVARWLFELLKLNAVIGVELQQFDRDRGVVEVHVPGLD